MKSPDTLYNSIHCALKEKGDPADIKKYSRYFREGYNAFGLDRKDVIRDLHSIIDPLMTDKEDMVQKGEKEVERGVRCRVDLQEIA